MKKIFFLFYTAPMLYKFFLFLCCTRLLISQPQLPSLFIEESVNVITGECVLFKEDLTVQGAVPISIGRFYNSKNKCEETAGWELLPHLYFYYEKNPKFYRHFFFQTLDGNTLYFTTPDEKEKGGNYKLELLYTYSMEGLALSQRETLSAENNIDNYQVEMTENERDVFVTYPSGRHLHYEKSPFQKNGFLQYQLKKEVAPSGHQMVYLYVEDKLWKILSLSPAGKEFASCELTHDDEDDMPPSFSLRSSDQNWIRYAFVPARKGKKCKHELMSVFHKGKSRENYAYCSEEKPCERPVESQSELLGKSLSYTYYKPGTHVVQGQRVDIEEKDRRRDRVKEILTSSESGEKKEPLYTFVYTKGPGGSGKTEVCDCAHNKTVYHYNGYLQIEKIERFNAKREPVYSEIYVWGKDRERGNLLAKVTLDENSKPLCAMTYSYDPWGNICEETLWGTLSGKGKACIELDENQMPKDNGVEHYTKKFCYSQEGKNLLLWEEEENGLGTRYVYDEKSSLLTAQLATFLGKVYLRTFYLYEEGLVTEKIEDDGTTDRIEDLEGVTERHITCYQLKKTTPFYGLPERVEKCYYDLNTHQKVLLEAEAYKYGSNGKIKEKALYDGEGKLQKVHSYTYDKNDRLESETNPLGQTAFYSYKTECFHPLTVKEFHGNTTLTYEYSRNWQPKKITATDLHQNTHVQQMVYDPKNRLLQKTDRFGNSTEYVYDSEDHCIETRLPKGIRKLQTYNVLGHLIGQTDGLGNATTITRNIYGQPLITRHSDGTVEKRGYSKEGRLLAEMLPNGSKIDYTYDFRGRVTSKSTYSKEGELLKKEEYEYNALHLLSSTDAGGIRTEYGFDGLGRKIRESRGRMETTYAYDSLGRLDRLQRGDQVTLYSYDLADRVIEERREDASEELFFIDKCTYDSFGNKKEIERSVGERVAFESTLYDGFNRPVESVDPEGRKTLYFYDQWVDEKGVVAEKQILIAPNGNQTEHFFDPLGQLLLQAVKDPFGTPLTTTTYAYDLNGNCVEQVQSLPEGDLTRQVVVKKEYTNVNKIFKIIESPGTKEQKVTTYSYDEAGRLSRIEPPNKLSISYTYDSLNRLETLEGFEVSYLYSYDPYDRVIEVEDRICHATTKRLYDDEGNLTQEELQNGLTLQSNYDVHGRRTELILPDQSKIDYLYDAYRLRQIKRNGHVHTFSHYDHSGNLLEDSLGSYRYTLDGKRSTIDSPYFKQEVTERDLLGNPRKRITNQREEHFSYSPLSQLIEEPTLKYTYDPLQNRLSKNGTSYNTNNVNQLESANEVHYTYDKAGNPTSKTGPEGKIQYVYDGLGRMILAQKEQKWRLTFAYDSFHRQVSKTFWALENGSWTPTKEGHFLYDGDLEIGIYEMGKLKELRILGPTPQAERGAAVLIETPNATYLPIHDLQGSLCTLVDTKSHAVHACSFSAYGEALAPPLLSWGYCSKRHDPDLDLIFFGRRYYEPDTGRFFTPDPAGFNDSLNLYAYCLNNPLQHADLFGLNIYVEVHLPLSDAAKIAGGALSMLGSGLYHTSRHAIPFEPFQKAGMFVGNLFSWQSRPLGSAPSGTHLISGREHPDASATFINGILNELGDAKGSGQFLSRCLGNMQTNCYYSQSKGFVGDLLAAICGILGFQNEDSLKIAMHLKEKVALLKTLSENPRHFVFAHSRGGIFLGNALKLLSSQEKGVLHVYTFGSASLFQDPHLGSLKHYVASRDPVPFFSLPQRLKAQFTSTGNVFILPSQDAFLEHSLLGGVYKSQIRRVGESILESIE
jgi:RHS repeat-associated protein